MSEQPEVEFEDTADRLALIAAVEAALRTAMRVQIIANHQRLYGVIVMGDDVPDTIIAQLDPNELARIAVNQVFLTLLKDMTAANHAARSVFQMTPEDIDKAAETVRVRIPEE